MHKKPGIRKFAVTIFTLVIAFILVSCNLLSLVIKSVSPSSEVPKTKTALPVKTVQPTKTQAKSPTPVSATPTSQTNGEDGITTFQGDYNGILYELNYPEGWVHTTSGEWENLCMDELQKLCISIHPQSGDWEDAEKMEEAIMLDFAASVADYQEYHKQSTSTFDGFQAYWVGYTFTRRGNKLEGSRLFVLIQHVGFDIVVFGDPEMMDANREITKNAVESFRLNFNRGS